MKAIYMRAPKDLKFEEVPNPVLHDDEVLIKVMAVGVCGSDIPRMLVFGAHVSPIIPGHEFAGKIHAYRTPEQKEADYFAIRERLKQSGLLRKGEDLPSAMRNASCIADNDAGETILPDGRVGRCEHFSESMITGDLYHEERDPDVTRKWKERLVVPACRDCALYPRCRKLAMCEWNRDGCDELERRIDRIRTEEQMLKAYHDRKKEETKHETD